MSARAGSRLGALACAVLLAACGDRPQEATPAPEPVRVDPRIEALLVDCARAEYFGEDTSHLLPVLVGKLVRGLKEPLRGAKRDIAAAGEAALPELERLVDSELAASGSSDVLRNVLGTIAQMEPPLGREIVLRLLDDPRETVRLSVLRVAPGRLREEDFARLLPLVDAPTAQLRLAAVAPLFDAAPERAAEAFLAWIRAGEHEGLWEHAVAQVVARDELADRAAELSAALAERDGDAVRLLRASLAGVLAERGDEAALASLRTLLDSDVSAQRYAAVEALAAAGLGGELREVLRKDPDPRLRALAAHAIGALPAEARPGDALDLGLSDEDETVRGTCLTALLADGDEDAVDFAFSRLESSPSDRQLAMRALAPAMAADPALAAEVLGVLRGVLEERYADVEASQRANVYQALGQIPTAEAARFLLERADAERGEIEGIPARRWLLLQAGNTGPAGRAVLAEAWRAESDPVRRLDLLAPLFGADHAEARAYLLEAVTREDVTPGEVLVAAHDLMGIGPAQVVAPVLKRVALRIEDGPVRRALQCLLWRYYGSEG